MATRKPSSKAQKHDNGAPRAASAPARSGITDYRLEKPDFRIELVREGEETRYVVHGRTDAPVAPLRESKYLSREQCLEIYRFMHLNRRMETALENLYKQGKVV